MANHFNSRRPARVLLFFLVSLATSLSSRLQASDRIDFSRDVLPILSDKCFACHGPDTQDVTMLRLDTGASATAARENGKAVDPEQPAQSLLLRRIQSTDDPMPPEDAEKQLTAAERDILKRWILDGGAYGQHWSFVPPAKTPPAPPAPFAQGQPLRHTIDQFVLQRLQRQFQDDSLELAPPAERTTLARRMALVLTGLPPEPQQLAAFVADESDNALEAYVDQLLDSERFGEHQARYWLDAVRYGDTHGLHLDNRRGIYPYRDWVVRAFNENLPLDDFLVWQLAGDLLPDPTMEQLVATGFVRMNPTTAEGGAIPAEFQAKNNFDRVETLGTVLLGMTLTCARCHTHKYDPISQTEYYELLAFFNSTAEPSMDGNKYEYGPVVRVPPDYHAWDRWRELQAEVASLNDNPTLTQIRKRPATSDYQRDAAAFKTRDNTHDWLWLDQATQTPPTEEQLAQAKSFQDVAAAAKWKPAAGKPGVLGFTVDLKAPQTLTLRCNAKAAAKIVVETNGETASVAPNASEGRLEASLTLPAGESRVWVLLPTPENKPLDVSLSSPWQHWNPEADWTIDAPERLEVLVDAQGPFANAGMAEKARALRQAIDVARDQFTTTLIARDLSQPRETRLLHRGEYDQPRGEPLAPGTFAVLGKFPDEAPKNRLGLARWLTSRDHPLVTRVLVNRLWQRIFGAGLVRSPEDFGLQGEQPTHPALLDWLAVEMHDSGWNQKELLREFVLSKTFQQSSAFRQELNDPENRWLARGPSYRLDAEVLRDVGLWASGLLDPHMGGEGVKPYQPPGMWKALAHPASNTKLYVPDKGNKIYRRSLYVYWKRTSPHPMMTLFDAPDRESSCVRRSRTNTALQSLGMLNETQRVEMARAFAERLLTSNAGDGARLEQMFKLVACRAPHAPEAKALRKLLAAMKQRFQMSKQDAEQLISTGNAPRDPSLDAVEHAAWTLVCSTFLASDLALTLY